MSDIQRDLWQEGFNGGFEAATLAAIKSLIQISEVSACEAMRHIGIATVDYGKYEWMLATH